MSWHDTIRHTPWVVDGEVLRDCNDDEVAVFSADTNGVERALLALAPTLYDACRRLLEDAEDMPTLWNTAALRRIEAAVAAVEHRP